MNPIDDQNLDDVSELEETPEKGAGFVCPNCGDISRDDVLFLCNTCDASELIHKEGMYICPSCMVPGDNFECNLCGSTKVTMKQDSNE